MDKIRIKNLRSLEDTGEVAIRPLTVLVGRNSSGKSTFLRFFPLMKQTIETRTNEPILWYSSRYVDFGSFRESLNYKNTGEAISFEFEFRLPRNYVKLEVHAYTMYRYRMNKQLLERETEEFFNFKIKVECKEKFIEKMVIHFEDHIIKMSFKNKDKLSEFSINDREYDPGLFVTDYSRNQVDFLPKITFKESESIHYSKEYFTDLLFNQLKEMAYISTSKTTIMAMIENVFIGDSEQILENFKTQNTTAQKLLENLNNLNLEDDSFKSLKNNILGTHLNRLIALCNKYIEVNFSKVRYIAPLRASAERYYRIQGVSVDEIDPQGANIPMMLHNMGDNKDREEFNKWIDLNFGFKITTSLEGGHTSLKIKYSDGDQEINLADTGFGYSQILPIILVLWQTIHKKRKLQRLTSRSRMKEQVENSVYKVVIEQPELHLHPAVQAKLIDTFVQLIIKAQETKIDLKIIIETHSETMLNRIGYLIAKKQYGFHKDLVNVILFNKIDAYHTSLESTGYSEKGQLIKWPIGFFSPEDF
ncbi:AAA family ATPase (plasmid) [Bacillus thuringiensis]|nr:AAA family ATPase [Bacillus thuringiensis]